MAVPILSYIPAADMCLSAGRVRLSFPYELRYANRVDKTDEREVSLGSAEVGPVVMSLVAMGCMLSLPSLVRSEHR